MSGIRERFGTWWFDGIPQPVSDRMFDRVVNEEVRAVADRLVAENRQLAADLDAAQNEIEKLLSEKEALRERLADGALCEACRCELAEWGGGAS